MRAGAAPAHGRRSRHERGLSLLEVVIASAMSFIVLLAGGGLYLMLLRHCAHEVSREPAVGGRVDVALRQVERDVERARAFPRHHLDFHADRETLLLRLPQDQVVIYRRDGNRLMRRVCEDPLDEGRERVLVEDVSVSEFRRLGTKMMEALLRKEEGDLRRVVVIARNLDRPRPDESPEEAAP